MVGLELGEGAVIFPVHAVLDIIAAAADTGKEGDFINFRLAREPKGDGAAAHGEKSLRRAGVAEIYEGRDSIDGGHEQQGQIYKTPKARRGFLAAAGLFCLKGAAFQIGHAAEEDENQQHEEKRGE